MSSIFKLQISGVRSFDSNDPQTIQFGKPLTLIVGQNGTGKTTIIECLKYATTGDMPPNSKGGAFVHDPNIAGAREVNGQVRLSFVTSSNKKAIVTRSMLLTMKKTARSFKTLDTNIHLKDKHKDIQLNSRCADIDAEMSRFLGVSKAVLEYVIFCHQEDSLWPLAEPSIVKKRFDDIFEATKFTKALDDIKTARKEYNAQIIAEKKDVQAAQTTKERADQTRSRAEALQNQIDESNEECVKLQEEMDQIATEQNTLFEGTQRFQRVLVQIDQLGRDKESFDANIARLLEGVEEMEDSDQQLQSKLDNFTSKTNERHERRIEKEGEEKKIEGQLSEQRQVYNTKLTRQGQLKAEKTAYEENVKVLDSFVNNAVKRLELGCPSDAKSLGDALKSGVNNASRKMDSKRADNNAAEQELANELNKHQSDKTRAEQKRTIANDAQQEHEQKLRQVQKELDGLQVGTNSLEFHQENLKLAEEELKKASDKLKDGDFENRISEQKSQRYQLDQKLSMLNQEFRESNDKADSRSKLKFYRDELKSKNDALQKLKDVQGQDYYDLVGRQVSAETAERDLQDAIEEMQGMVAKLEKQVAKLNSDKSSYATRLEILQTDLKDKEREQEKLENKLQEYTGDDSTEDGWQRAIKTRQDAVKEQRAKLKSAEVLESFAREALEHTKDEAVAIPTCSLCRREVVKEERSQVIAALEEYVEYQRGNKQLSGQVDQADREIEALKDLAPTVDRIKVLRDREVSEVKGKISALKDDIDDCKDELQEPERKLEAKKKLVETAEGLNKFASEVTRYCSEIKSLEQKVKNLEMELGDGSNRPADEIHADISKINTQIKTADSQIAEFAEDRDWQKDRLQKAQTNVSNKQLEISKFKNDLHERTNKEAQIKSIKEQQQKSLTDSAEAGTVLAQVEPKIDEISQKLQKLKYENEAGMQAMREQSNKLSQAQYELEKLNEAVKKYSGDDELEKCERDLQLCTERTSSLEQDLKQVKDAIQTEKDAFANLKAHERTLRDNLEIRRLRKEIGKINKQVEELDHTRAKQESQRYENETRKLQQKLTKVSGEHANKLGQVKQMQVTLQEYNTDLENQFMNASELYRDASLKLGTTQSANEDLERYAKALEHAVMRYHSIKMERINATIGDLWRQTYAGTDLDTIMIKSDSSTGNKSHNYRVVMVKGDTELDMRGRCSAGQKVLACIIIRLALAETFGANCGMIALDEPTTNLDKQNIEALAGSLNQLLETRQSQRNFQLITITHDLEFLRHIKASDYTDHYYKVERDGHKSKISSVDITNIEG